MTVSNANATFSEADITRFNAHVHKGDGCWEWTATTHKKPKPYGVFYAAGRNWLAHRVSWMLAKGAIPEGLFVCYTCDNPRCVRPDHLFLGTNRDNIRDASRKGRIYGQRPTDDVRRGERHGQAKLNESAVRQVRALRALGVRITALARMFGVSRRAIEFVLRGDTWSHVA